MIAQESQSTQGNTAISNCTLDPHVLYDIMINYPNESIISDPILSTSRWSLTSFVLGSDNLFNVIESSVC